MMTPEEYYNRDKTQSVFMGGLCIAIIVIIVILIKIMQP